jgi:hypothetical protein
MKEDDRSLLFTTCWLLIGWPKNYGSYHDVLGVTDSEDYAKDWVVAQYKIEKERVKSGYLDPKDIWEFKYQQSRLIKREDP